MKVFKLDHTALSANLEEDALNFLRVTASSRFPFSPAKYIRWHLVRQPFYVYTEITGRLVARRELHVITRLVNTLSLVLIKTMRTLRSVVFLFTTTGDDGVTCHLQPVSMGKWCRGNVQPLFEYETEGPPLRAGFSVFTH